jgi:hypothetical protein
VVHLVWQFLSLHMDYNINNKIYAATYRELNRVINQHINITSDIRMFESRMIFRVDNANAIEVAMTIHTGIDTFLLYL